MQSYIEVIEHDVDDEIVYWVSLSLNTRNFQIFSYQLKLLNLKTITLSYIELNKAFCWELVPYEFPLVVLHTISMMYFRL